MNSRKEKGEASLSISLGHSLPTLGLPFYIFFLFCVNPISGPMSLFERVFTEKSYKINYNLRGGGGVGMTPWYSSKSTHTIVSNQSNSKNNNEDNSFIQYLEFSSLITGIFTSASLKILLLHKQIHPLFWKRKVYRFIYHLPNFLILQPNNRFNVPVGTKFYRIKAIPWER